MTTSGLEKAKLQEIFWDDSQQTEDKPKSVQVQFNPESLKLSFSSQNAGGDQRGGSAIQYVGSGTTKLSFDLWFDVTSIQRDAEGSDDLDVRDLTEEVVYFITPKPSDEEGKYIPPGVRFEWGSFSFEGVMDSLNESLEYFSEGGNPLRSKVSVSLTRQEIKYEGGQPLGGLGSSAPGGLPQQARQVAEGETAQSIARTAGKGDDWPAVAAANGIENPRAPATGSFLDPGRGEAPGPSAEGGLAAGAAFGTTADAETALGGGLRAGAAGGLRAGVTGGVQAGVGGGLRGIGGSAGLSVGGSAGATAGGAVSGGAAASAAARAGASFDARRRRS